MKLFVLFLGGCFFLGVLLWNRPPSSKRYLLLGLCGLVAFAYLFLGKI